MTVPEDIMDSAIQKGADALERFYQERLAKAVSNVDLDVHALKTFFQAVASEDDRALAIVVHAFVDDRLRRLFCHALNPEVVGGRDALFEGFGPLSSSHARIELAAALYWLSPATYRNLRLMRRIRNEFAHNPHVNSLTHDRVAGLVSSMDPLEARVFAAVTEVGGTSPEISHRLRYYARCCLTCHSMIAELASAPIAERMGLSPHAALTREFAAIPSSIQELATATVRVVLEVCGFTFSEAMDDSVS